MHGSRLPLLLVILLAILALGWFLLGAGDGDPASDDDLASLIDDDDDANEANGSRPGRLPEAPATPAAPVPVEAPPPEPRPPIRSTDEIPRGGIDVYLTDAEGDRVAPGEVTVRLIREGPRFWSEPLGVADVDTGALKFRTLPTGKIKVRVHGARFAEIVVGAEIREGEIVEARIELARGGAVRYEIALSSGEKPAQAKLSISLEGGRGPLNAIVRPDHRSLVQAKEAPTGPGGRIEGLLPGAYVLRASVAAGESAEARVEVLAGQTTDVSIHLRRP